jgi:hypothetical protein
VKRLCCVVYDLEIVRCVPQRGEPRDPQYQYCEGWHDKAGMGISVIGALDLRTWTPRVFLEDNFSDFVALCADVGQVVGFNSISFDDAVCAAAGLDVQTTYDLKAEFLAACPDRKAGRRLDDIARANLGVGKSGSGADAPKLWQRGMYGQVIDYCLTDVRHTAMLVTMLPELIDPVSGRRIVLRDLAATGKQEVLL